MKLSILLLIGLVLFSCKKDDLNSSQNMNEFGFTLNAETNIFSFDLENLDTIKGNIQISNTALSDLSILKGIKCIEGVLRISNNDNLSNLNGLENLDCLEEIHIQLNSKLENITAIENSNISKSFVLLQNNIESIGSMSNLIQLTGDFTIDEPFLSNLQVLENLAAVEGTLSIVNNQQINDLDELSSLELIGTKLNLLGNANLEDFCGLKQALENSPNIEAIIMNNKENLSASQILMICE